MVSLRLGDARNFATAVLEAAGMPPRHAARTGWALSTADAWGRASHGLMRLHYYVPRFGAGGTDPRAMLRLVRETPVTACYDGENGLGHWQCWDAAEEACRRAQEYGIGAVSIANSGHNGALGLYVLPMVEKGLIGLATSNGPAVMPPASGHAPLLSTSPIAAGFPSKPRPIIVDMATSAVARGRIAQAAQRGEAIPEGWGFDAHGAPTTDATVALAGMVAPIGGAKGFALALVTEALTGAMVGPRLAGDIGDSLTLTNAANPQGSAHFVVALDPAAFDGDGNGVSRMALLNDRIGETGGRAPGASYPIGSELRDDFEIELPEAVMNQLREIAVQLSITAPEPVVAY